MRASTLQAIAANDDESEVDVRFLSDGTACVMALGLTVAIVDPSAGEIARAVAFVEMLLAERGGK